MSSSRHPDLANAGRSQLLVVDVQERFVPAFENVDELTTRIAHLIVAADACGVPVLASEQVPEKLGHTVQPLADLLPQPIAKTAFSAADLVATDDIGSLEEHRDQVVLCGIETHICILQTAMDLLARGCRPIVVSDACRSRDDRNHSAAIARLLNAGVDVATTEMILFEWLQDATHPAFRAVSKLIR